MKKALIICGVFVALQLAFGFAATFLTTAITGEVNSLALLSQPTYLYLTGAFLILCNIIMFLMVGYMFTNRCLGAFTDRIRHASGKVWLWGIVCLLLLMVVINGFTELFDIPNLLEAQMDKMLCNPLCLIAILLIGPIGEEVVFRRGAIDALSQSKRFAPWAIIISSLIFGLIHFNPIQIIGAFFVGMYLGWIYVATNRNLLIPIVFHIINNAASVVIYYALGKDFHLMEQFQSKTAFAIFLIVLALLFLLLFRKLQAVVKN